MLLSKTGRYALMATLEIARRGRDAGPAEAEPVRAAELAGELGIPPNYLAKILHQLGRAGVITSARGPHGGFRLARSADELRLEAVIDPVVPSLREVDCLLGRPACRDDDPCAVHEHWRAVTDHLRQFLHETTLADLLARGPEGGSRKKEKRRAR